MLSVVRKPNVVEPEVSNKDLKFVTPSSSLDVVDGGLSTAKVPSSGREVRESNAFPYVGLTAPVIESMIRAA